VERLAGSNRYSTAVSISQMGWPDCQGGSDTVILAVGSNFPDSLSGVTLAYKLDAPILLTAKDTLSAPARAEIERLQAKHVIILGGVGAVSNAVVSDLNSIAGIQTVSRIAGADRYQTAREIAMHTSLDYSAIYLASGLTFPDALSAAAYAAKQGRPIMLNGKTTLSGSVKTLLAAKPEIKLVVIVGGPGAIADSVIDELHALGTGLTVQRISGSDRYETSLKLASYLWDEGGKDIFLATGANFPDALAGGVLAAKHSSCVLLVRSTAQSVPSAIATLMDELSIEGGLILGGTSAITATLEADLYQKLKY
jgi:putative cell wall-binding protein